jgi:hypothetical protein
MRAPMCRVATFSLLVSLRSIQCPIHHPFYLPSLALACYPILACAICVSPRVTGVNDNPSLPKYENAGEPSYDDDLAS